MLETDKLCSAAYKNYLNRTDFKSEFCEGIRNYWDGDEVFYYPNKIERVDYKYIREYVSIELVQVTSKYDSWLYNTNIHKIVYFDGSKIYEFDRQQLLNFAYFLSTNFDLRRTSVLYDEKIHSDALKWAVTKLNELKDDTYFKIPNFRTIVNSISSSGVHMNIAHNRTSKFSGINIRIPTNLL